MPETRPFSNEELKEMGKRNVDALIEAIDVGDLERAKKLAQRMYQEDLAMHDGLIDWIAATLSFIGRHYGDEALSQALREGCNAWFQPIAESFAHAEARHRAKMLAKLLRGHMMPIRIEEDDEKYVFIMEPCGSGGRLVLRGKHKPPRDYFKIKKPQPMTCGKKDFPVYCAHAGILSILGIEFYGAPVFFEEPSDNIGEKPCKFYLYKDPKDAPSALYEMVGKKKGSSY